MPNIGPMELVIVLVVVLLLFGSTRLPKLAKSIGEASQEFKKGVQEGHKTDDAPKALAESTSAADEQVTITRAELEALTRDRQTMAAGDPE